MVSTRRVPGLAEATVWMSQVATSSESAWRISDFHETAKAGVSARLATVVGLPSGSRRVSQLAAPGMSICRFGWSAVTVTVRTGRTGSEKRAQRQSLLADVRAAKRTTARPLRARR